MNGIKADLIIYDEMDDIPEELFKEMFNRAFTPTNGKIIIISTPSENENETDN